MKVKGSDQPDANITREKLGQTVSTLKTGKNVYEMVWRRNIRSRAWYTTVERMKKMLACK